MKLGNIVPFVLSCPWRFPEDLSRVCLKRFSGHVHGYREMNMESLATGYQRIFARDFKTCFDHNSSSICVCLKRFSGHVHGYREMNRGEFGHWHTTLKVEIGCVD